jgi:hypothetical protein
MGPPPANDLLARAPGVHGNVVDQVNVRVRDRRLVLVRADREIQGETSSQREP